MNIQKIDIEKLQPAIYNPRKDLKPTDREYQKIKQSIQTFGHIDPLIINSDYTIIGGHQRLKVLKELGYTQIDCVVVDLDKEQEKALNIALNKISGEWEMTTLKELLDELDQSSLDVELTGFDRNEIEELFKDDKQVDEDDFNPDEAEQQIVTPVTQPGDIWQLGRHRLMCGDATKLADLQTLMNGQHADMVFTDPPYNVDYQGGTKEKLKIMNDKMETNAFYRFLLDFYSAAIEVTKRGGPIYICYGDGESNNFRQAMKDGGWELKQCLIWAKSSLVLGRQDYQWKHEPILYGWRPGAAHKWYGGYTETTVIEDDFDVVISDGKTKQIHIRRGNKTLTIEVPSYEIKHTGDDATNTIWRFEKPSKNEDHPTMKPVGLAARAIRNSSKIGDAVLDCFGGSGTTAIAAEQTGRKAFLMELDPKYCDVIVRRWEEFTGQTAERIEANAQTTGIVGEQPQTSDAGRNPAKAK